MSIGLLAGLLVLVVSRRGPLQFRAPATVLSNSHPAQKGAEPQLLFLHEIRKRLPPGATVAVTDNSDGDPGFYLIALSQLPQQTVVQPLALKADLPVAALPDYLACFGETREDARYRLVETVPGGALYKVIR